MSIGLRLLVGFAGVVVIWCCCRRWPNWRELQRELHRPLSPMQGGTPQNIRRTRPRFELARLRTPPGWVLRLDHVHWNAVESRFNGAYRVAWIDWQLIVAWFGHGIAVRHWRERHLA